MAAAAMLKIRKTQYLRNKTTDFDAILHSDATATSGRSEPIKFREFKNPDGDGDYLENQKNRNISAMDGPI